MTDPKQPKDRKWFTKRCVEKLQTTTGILVSIFILISLTGAGIAFAVSIMDDRHVVKKEFRTFKTKTENKIDTHEQDDREFQRNVKFTVAANANTATEALLLIYEQRRERKIKDGAPSSEIRELDRKIRQIQAIQDKIHSEQVNEFKSSTKRK